VIICPVKSSVYGMTYHNSESSSRIFS